MRSQPPSGDIHFWTSVPFAQETDETPSVHHAIQQETVVAADVPAPTFSETAHELESRTLLPVHPSSGLTQTLCCLQPRWVFLPQHLDQYTKEKCQRRAKPAAQASGEVGEQTGEHGLRCWTVVRMLKGARRCEQAEIMRMN